MPPRPIPSRHVTAALWGMWLMGVLMAYALHQHQPEAIMGIGGGFALFFGALGGSAYARHNGAREPSGGVAREIEP